MKRTERNKTKSEQDHNPPDEHNPHAPNNERKVSGKVHVGGYVEVGFPENLMERYEACQEKTRPHENRAYWLTFSTLVFVVFTALAAFWQGRSSSRSADAATKAANTAKDELELSERPWVSAQIIINGPLQWEADGATATFMVHLLNSGHSPAQAVIINPRTYVCGAPMMQDEVNFVKNDTTRIVKDMAHFGLALFPNEPFQQQYKVTFNRSDIAQCDLSPKQKGVLLNPVVIFGIGYRAGFNAAIYHSTYVLDLGVRDENGTKILFPAEQNIPLQNLIMWVHPDLGVTAD